jgi:phosphate starvation-inducible PhoH-like protein
MLIEKIITLDSVEPVEIYGVNDVKLNIIKKHFPKLKLIARGYSLILK